MPFLIAVPVAVLLIAGYVVYDRRYHGKAASGLRPTEEVFRDPATGKLMRVHENPTTGEREYVDEDD
jgi:hypothetical protein